VHINAGHRNQKEAHIKLCKMDYYYGMKKEITLQ